MYGSHVASAACHTGPWTEHLVNDARYQTRLADGIVLVLLSLGLK